MLSALASAGFTALVLSKLPDGGAQILSGGKTIATIPANFNDGVIFITKPYQNMRCVVKRYTIANTVTTKPSTPTDTIKNPFNDARLLTMSIRPDPTNGKVHLASEINVNGSDLLYSNAFADLTDIDSVNIPMPNEGLALQNSQNINLYFWNDGTQCNVTVYALIGRK